MLLWFQNIYPARGRKRAVGVTVRVGGQGVSKYLPRKGTETGVVPLGLGLGLVS